MQPKISVLVCDDNETFTEQIERLLSTKGCTVESSNTIIGAKDKLLQKKYDVIIIDVKIPDDSPDAGGTAGLELLRFIRSENIQIGVILLTAFPSIASLDLARSLGISSYLEKSSILVGGRNIEETATVLFDEVKKAAMKNIPFEEITRIVESDPYKISYNEFMKLDSRGRNKIIEKGRKQKQDWAISKLRELKSKWLVICGTEIVRHSGNLDDLPSPDELEKIGEEKILIPFPFVDRSINEELSANTSSWSDTRDVGDYYPTLDVKISNGKENLTFKADFDTGSPLA